MNVQKYLQDKLLAVRQVQPNVEEVATLRQKGLEQYIFDKVTSKKFRKWSIDENTKKLVREAIATNLDKKQPIQFTLPFGGYKIWRVPSSPEVDWAEFFSICYYALYLSQITSVYEPGASLCFSSDDVIVEQMDNIPKSDTEAYFTSFQTLLNFFRPYFPKNLSLRLIRVADLYASRLEYDQELAEKILEMKKIYKTLDSSIVAGKRKTSEFNIHWDGAKDLTSLTEKEKRDLINLGPILHDGYCTLSKRKAFVRGQDKIVIFPSVPINNGIAIGSTKNSIVKFWTGFGVIHEGRFSFQDRILSPKQIDQIKDEKHETIDIDLVPLKNFQKIMSFQKDYNFSTL